jgi:SAM-dependent methyltransferase
VVASLEDLAPELRFDVIVAMDVIEHVPSPRALLVQLLSRLAPGGRLLITTGDGTNPLWRLVGARWWYCYYPEHIAFISRRWLRFHAARIGCSILRVDTFNYFDERGRGARRRWLDWLKYLMRPVRHARKRERHLAEHGSDMGVPGMGLTRDHLLVQLAKP